MLLLTRCRLFAVVALVGLMGAARAQHVSVDEANTRVSFPIGNFALDLPIQSDAAATASIKAEIIDPNDAVISQATAPCKLNSGLTHCKLTLPPLASHHSRSTEQLGVMRLRYTVTSGSRLTGTISLSRIAPTLYEFHVVGPHEVHPSGAYTARVRALHPLTGEPRAGVKLTAELTATFKGQEDGRKFDTQSLTTDAQGFATVSFTAPVDTNLRSISLNIVGRQAGTVLIADQDFPVPTNASLQLTTDKPLYQPGQTVRTRILLLDENGHASAKKSITLDVEDPDSTLVFRAKTITSRYGIASADWAVPARMRLGGYSLKAESDGKNGQQQIRISRYDLPTFTVEPKPDRAYYLTDTNAIVDVRANYLFGKPVLHGHVRVVREDERTWNYREQKYDTKEGKSVEGELDAKGSFLAHLDLSDNSMEDRDEERSNDYRDLHFAAYVTDASSNRTEQRRFDLRVTQQALHLYLIGHESQQRGLPTRVYVAVTSADGVPAECDLDISLLPHESSKEKSAQSIARALPLIRHLHTNALGLAQIDLPTYEALQKQMPPATPGTDPNLSEDPELHIAARDKQGRTGSLSESLSEPDADIRVTTRKSLYRTGDPIDVTIEAPSLKDPKLPITLQLIRATEHGELVLDSREIKLTDGRATERFATDDRYSGYIFVVASTIVAGTPRPRPRYRYYNIDDAVITSSRALLFPRDNALHVNVELSHDTYHPGDDATAKLTVRGPQDIDGDIQDTAPAAIGLVAVDQAVTERNRTDNEFGGSTFFFRWVPQFYTREVAGISLPGLQQLDLSKPIPGGIKLADLELAATILLEPIPFNPDTDKSGSLPEPSQAFSALLGTKLTPSRKFLTEYLKTNLEAPTTSDALAKLLASQHIDFLSLRDPWDRPFELVTADESNGRRVLQLRTDGPDKLSHTADDFSVPLASWSWFGERQRALQNAIVAYHLRTNGYIRDLVALRDEMHQEHLDFDAWRDPWGQPFTYTFSIVQSNFAVQAFSAGDPAQHSPYGQNTYQVGFAAIDYFAEQRAQLESSLNEYAQTHPYPTNEAAFEAALNSAHISRASLKDPWGHPLYAIFHAHTFFTDAVHTDAQATPGGNTVIRTKFTPITAVSDIITLRSPGPDGKQGSEDDFTLANLTHLRTQQSAKDQQPKKLTGQPVRADAAGGITGVVTDITGASISNASITATSLATGQDYTANTNSAGLFQMDALPAGTYTVHITSPGFMSFVYEQVTVIAGSATELDASLNVGAATETVEVSAEAATLETSSASIGSLTYVNGFTGGRSFALLKPGVLAPAPPPSGTEAKASTPRVRDYFPETLLWRPEIITSDDGHATAHFRVADNITTWQLSAAASTLQGNTGGGYAEFRAFQPFFAAFDPPRVLTTGDTIALPIALRNYLDHALTVTGELTPAPWLRIEASQSENTAVPSQDSASPVFRFTAIAPIVDAPMQFIARTTDKKTGDAIAKPVTVHPDGVESAATDAGILSPGPNQFTLNIPADMLTGGNDATLKLYPNLAAHLRDALVAMAHYPDGCGEQIISISWPSLLLQRYASQLPHADKKLRQQTHAYLEEAYENLLSNQHSDGGFGYWPSDKYSDPALTAYAIQFLQQSSAFITIDENVIKTAVTYLAKQQQPQGKPNAGFWLTSTRDNQSRPEDRRGNAMLTASIAAMISAAPNTAPLIANALTATQPFVEEFDEPYTLANYTLAALAVKDIARSKPSIVRLRSLALSENGGAYWKLETNTPFFGWGRAGRVESTAQVLHALLASGATQHDDLIARGLLFLDHEQDRHSLWYSTQATARVLDVLSAMTLTTKASPAHAAPGTLTVSIDGRAPTSTPLPAPDSDAGPIFIPLGSELTAGDHHVTLTLPSTASSATAQIVANFYRPWPKSAPVSATTNNEQLRLAVHFNTTSPTVGTTVEATAHVERVGFRGYGMLIAEIGLPPGADVDRASLESAMTASGYQLNHYDVLPDKVLVYLWPNAGGFDLKFKFKLRYAIDALTAPSIVYDYYNPDSHFDLPPSHFASH